MKKNIEYIGRAYKENYSVNHKKNVHNYDIPYQVILKYLHNYSSDIKILDAGCGNGRYARKIYNQTDYKNITAIDIFDNNIENIKFINSSVDETPFEKKSFDFIYSLSVVYYTKSIKKTLEEMSRLLKPGGIIIITTFNNFSSFALIRKLKRKLFTNTKYMLSEISFFSPGYYIRIAKNNNLKIIEHSGYCFPQYAQFLNYLEAKSYKTNIFPNIIKPSKNKAISKIKAYLGYHQIIVLQKENEI